MQTALNSAQCTSKTLHSTHPSLHSAQCTSKSPQWTLQCTLSTTHPKLSTRIHTLYHTMNIRHRTLLHKLRHRADRRIRFEVRQVKVETLQWCTTQWCTTQWFTTQWCTTQPARIRFEVRQVRVRLHNDVPVPHNDVPHNSVPHHNVPHNDVPHNRRIRFEVRQVRVRPQRGLKQELGANTAITGIRPKPGRFNLPTSTGRFNLPTWKLSYLELLPHLQKLSVTLKLRLDHHHHCHHHHYHHINMYPSKAFKKHENCENSKFSTKLYKYVGGHSFWGTLPHVTSSESIKFCFMSTKFSKTVSFRKKVCT